MTDDMQAQNSLKWGGGGDRGPDLPRFHRVWVLQ